MTVSTAIVKDKAAEQIHDDFQIPYENIEKAVAVQDYIMWVKNVATQDDLKQAFRELEREIERGGIRFKIEASFQNWSLVQVICNYYRRESYLTIVHRLILECIEKKDGDQIATYFHSLFSHSFLSEARELFPTLLDYAEKNNCMHIIHVLSNWYHKNGVHFDISSSKEYCQKIRFVKIGIYEAQKDACRLIEELNYFNPNDLGYREEIGRILVSLVTVLKSETEKKLAEYVRDTLDHSPSGNTETLAVLALLELIERYKKRK